MVISFNNPIAFRLSLSWLHKSCLQESKASRIRITIYYKSLILTWLYFLFYWLNSLGIPEYLKMVKHIWLPGVKALFLLKTLALLAHCWLTTPLCDLQWRILFILSSKYWLFSFMCKIFPSKLSLFGLLDSFLFKSSLKIYQTFVHCHNQQNRLHSFGQTLNF